MAVLEVAIFVGEVTGRVTGPTGLDAGSEAEAAYALEAPGEDLWEAAEDVEGELLVAALAWGVADRCDQFGVHIIHGVCFCFGVIGEWPLEGWVGLGSDKCGAKAVLCLDDMLEVAFGEDDGDVGTEMEIKKGI